MTDNLSNAFADAVIDQARKSAEMRAFQKAFPRLFKKFQTERSKLMVWTSRIPTYVDGKLDMSQRQAHQAKIDALTMKMRGH